MLALRFSAVIMRPINLMDVVIDFFMKKSLLIKIWTVCALGLFVDGFDLYITSVAEPLFRKAFTLSPTMLGLTQAAAPIGAALGAILIGRVSDKVGRKKMILFNFILFVVAALLSAVAWNVFSLILFRFLVGFGVGADYPICAAYMTEMSPDASRGRLIASAMFINCLASPIGVAVAYGLFSLCPHVYAWRLMFAFGAVPALAGLFLRARLPESFVWKVSQKVSVKAGASKAAYRHLFKGKYLKATIALGFSWLLMDISYYGIGLFTPDLLSALHFVTSSDFLTNTRSVVKSTLFLNAFVALGALASIFVIDRMPRIRLQKLGFLAAFLGLFVLAMSQMVFHQVAVSVVFISFIVYNFFINMGPGATTYLLPAEIYPTEIRATGHGVASGAAKFGAFLGAILLPDVQLLVGVHTLLLFLSFALLFGYFLTNLLKNYLGEPESSAVIYDELLAIPNE